MKSNNDIPSTKTSSVHKLTGNDDSCSSLDCGRKSRRTHHRKHDNNQPPPFYPPPMSGYYSLFPPPQTMPAMNYFYLDLLRHVSLESELRNVLPKLDELFQCNQKTESLPPKKITKKHPKQKKTKINSLHFINESCSEHCSSVCMSCAQVMMRCKQCSNLISGRKVSQTTFIPACKYCQCMSGSRPISQSFQPLLNNQCHCACQQQFQSRKHFEKRSYNYFPCEKSFIDTSRISNRIKRSKSGPKEMAPQTKANHSNSEEDISSEKDSVSDLRCMEKARRKKGSTNLEHKKINGESKTEYSSSENGLLPGYLGGTGDEKGRQLRKPRPQSTAYFLSIGS